MKLGGWKREESTGEMSSCINVFVCLKKKTIYVCTRILFLLVLTQLSSTKEILANLRHTEVTNLAIPRWQNGECHRGGND